MIPGIDIEFVASLLDDFDHSSSDHAPSQSLLAKFISGSELILAGLPLQEQAAVQ